MIKTTAKTMKIAFQGEPGANSHIAIVEAYPDAEPLPCPTFEDALAAITSGEADLGMIPIENSVAGRVADIHHLLPASGLFIVGEWFLPIRHQLMAPRGAKLADIKIVESHVHALGQCRRIIRKLGVKPIVAADTACRNMFPNMEPLPCPTFEDAFNAVETGKADLAMIPIENTIAGRVADIHHLLPES